MIFKNKIGLGTSILGLRPDLTAIHENFLDYTIQQGCRLYDTAESYANGAAESIIGRCITNSGSARNEFEIVTKFTPTNDPAVALQHSLGRLKTDYVDVYLMHFLTGKHTTDLGLKTIITQLAELKQQGLARNIGVCNITVSQLLAWQQAEQQLGIPESLRINVCQYQYSLVKRQADIELHALLDRLGFSAMPYSPFGGGRMSGSARPPQLGFAGDFWVNERTLKLAPVAASIGATVPQLILAFANRFHNSVAFPKTFDKRRFDDNLASVQFIPKITKSIYDQIDAVYPIDFSVKNSTADLIHAATVQHRQTLPDQ